MANLNEVYENLKKMINKRDISQFVNVGSCACAFITKNNVYYGLNYKAESGLDRCAEQIALGNAIMNNDINFEYIMVYYRTGELITPCGVCRELIAQTGIQNLNAKIILSISPLKTVTLAKILPNWWGYSRHPEIKKSKKLHK